MTKWNPDNLTPAQVGNGWRLLDTDEVEGKPAKFVFPHTTVWLTTTRKWYERTSRFYVTPDSGNGGGAYTLRTQLTKEQMKTLTS